MTAFSKNSNCPSSEKLLAFQRGEARIIISEFIKKHLLECEFCSAEVELYSRYPQADDPIAKADIPPYLYDLAEALLSNREKEFKSLNKLLNENDAKHLVKM